MAKNNGGPAFPKTGQYELTDDFEVNCIVADQAGMTLRQYYAAKAMQGFISNPRYEDMGQTLSNIAAWSYQAADAMIAFEESEEEEPCQAVIHANETE